MSPARAAVVAAGTLLLLAGIWMMVSPQALLGLEQLRWMSRHTFPLEALLGAVVTTAGLVLLAGRPRRQG